MRQAPLISYLHHWTVAMILGAAALWLATDHLVTTFVVAGESMRPALAPGDRLLIDRWTYGQRLPRPGEIVLIQTERRGAIVKRVAETASPLSGGLWVLGDNPSDSLDSRTLGVVPPESVAGRVRWRYWPLPRAGAVH